MSLDGLLSQFLGGGASQQAPGARSGGNNMLGGLAGGAAAGGLVALLAGSKSSRKFMKKAATYGGMAVVGGLAYKAYQNWQANKSPAAASLATQEDIATPHPGFTPQALPQGGGASLELVLVKAMIAAAKADGHIDPTEQQQIFDAVEKMKLSATDKGVVFDCLKRHIPVEELASAVSSLEHKTEVYLAARLAIDPDQHAEILYLQHLAQALALPPGLPEHLDQQAQQALLN